MVQHVRVVTESVIALAVTFQLADTETAALTCWLDKSGCPSLLYRCIFWCVSQFMDGCSGQKAALRALQVEAGRSPYPAVGSPPRGSPAVLRSVRAGDRGVAEPARGVAQN